MKNIHIRAATMSDAKTLLNIYKPYVEKTVITFEFVPPTLEEFQARMKKVMGIYPYFVAEIDGEIVGYTYASTFKDRPAYNWSVETSIYVREDAKGLGVGRKLYEILEKALAAQNILNANACIAYAEIEDEYLNKDSVKFHEKMGYRLVGEFHKCGYKFNRWYNMIWMEKHLGEHEVNQEEVIPFGELKNEY